MKINFIGLPGTLHFTKTTRGKQAVVINPGLNQGAQKALCYIKAGEAVLRGKVHLETGEFEKEVRIHFPEGRYLSMREYMVYGSTHYWTFKKALCECLREHYEDIVARALREDISNTGSLGELYQKLESGLSTQEALIQSGFAPFAE